MCMRQQSAPRSATSAAISGSTRNAVTSLTSVAPAALRSSAGTGLRLRSADVRRGRSGVAAHLGGPARQVRPGDRARHLALGALGRQRRSRQLGLGAVGEAEDLLLVLAGEQREELL